MSFPVPPTPPKAGPLQPAFLRIAADDPSSYIGNGRKTGWLRQAVCSWTAPAPEKEMFPEGANRYLSSVRAEWRGVTRSPRWRRTNELLRGNQTAGDAGQRETCSREHGGSSQASLDPPVPRIARL